MEIIRVSDERFKLILDDADMKKYGITERVLTADGATRRRALLSLLDEVKRRTGVDAKGRSTLLEAFTEPSGGCEIFVTVEGEREALLFRFASLSHLSDALRRLTPTEAAQSASLYALDGAGYVLVIAPSSALPGHSPYGFFEEYGVRERGRHALAFVREYGTCLYKEDALSRVLCEKENFSV